MAEIDIIIEQANARREAPVYVEQRESGFLSLAKVVFGIAIGLSIMAAPILGVAYVVKRMFFDN